MKKYFVYLFIFIASVMSLASCLPNNDDEYQQYLDDLEAQQKKMYEQYRTDSTLIADYLVMNDSIADFDSIYGIYYHILEPGSEYHPDNYSTITFQYKGQLLDGTVFDQTKDDATVQYMLGNLIGGWQIGIPKIGAGGKIILYIPSVYGYGESVVGTIPANSVLIFDIDLISFY